MDGLCNEHFFAYYHLIALRDFDGKCFISNVFIIIIIFKGWIATKDADRERGTNHLWPHARGKSFVVNSTLYDYPVPPGVQWPCGMVQRDSEDDLKKMCEERPTDWDRYIDALLFAYRETPHDSTGFAPFELLYGRVVRGPLVVINELWTNKHMHDQSSEGQVEADMWASPWRTAKVPWKVPNQIQQEGNKKQNI